jgi:hypothetical protein
VADKLLNQNKAGGIMTLIITTFNIMTLSILGLFATLSIIDTNAKCLV